MRSSKIYKCLSLILSLMMIITMLPVSEISFAAEYYPVIMQFTAASGGDFHKYYKQVYSVTFLDKIDTEAMSEAIEIWDISADTNSGDVMAWMYLNEEATATADDNRYDVYIAGEGGVGANSQSGYIFYMFENLEKVNNTENFKTANATSLKALFYRCYKLKNIDLSTWDTSSVKDMSQIFDMTTSSNSSIVPALESVNLAGWDTSNVTTMSYMFCNCKNLLELDLSTFNTNNVINMERMFYLCMALERIYIGDNWNVEQVTNYNAMFNCCYAIVGGKDKYDVDFQYIPPGKEYAKLKEDGGFLTHISEKPQPEKKEYKVTYEFIGNIIPDGITVNPEEIYEEGSSVKVAPLPEAAGYEFSGWSTDDADITTGTFIINNDVHIVGSWDKLYNVKYKFIGDVPENAPVLPSYQFKAGETVSVDNLPFVSGYVFVGWSTDDVNINSNIFEMPEKDVVIYGYFKRPVESVEINGGDISLNYGDDTVINVTVKPEDATIKDIIYSSDNEEVVKIDKNGKITTVGAGSATITVKSKDDPTIFDTITVTVKIPVTDITVDKNEIILNKGENDKIDVTVVPENATNKELEYQSDNEDIVKIDENGNITSVGAGEATITVKSKDNPGVFETVKVTVKIPVTEITATNDFTLNVDDIKNVDAKTNEDATNKELTYESTDSSVVKVDSDGNVIAVGEGSATIIITSKDNPDIKKTVNVTVKVPVENVTADKESITLKIGDTDKLTATVTPDNATNKEVTYETSDNTVVKVDEHGNITAIGEGTATITVTSKDDPTKKDTVSVTVVIPEIPVTDVTADKDKITLDVGDTDKITVTVTPDDATNKEVIFESSDETIVKVDEYGNIKAVGEGNATITITSKDDPTKKDTVSVTVVIPEIPVTDVTADKDKITLDVGDTDKITVTVTPDDATNKEVIFESSDETIVKVDEYGNIKAVGEGNATITITSKDDPTKKDTVSVTVVIPEIPVTGVTADKDKITLDVGDTDKITVTVIPDNATNKEVIFESSDETIVKVDEYGNIKAVGEGTATITVTSKDDPAKKDTISVTVVIPEIPVTGVTADKDEITLDVGDTDKITVTVTPDDATNKEVIFESSDETIVKVDEYGNITAIGEGNATITVSSKDDPTKKDTVTVNVIIPGPDEPQPPEYIIEVPDKMSVFIGETKNLNVKVTPAEGYPKPTFTSSDDSIVTVDSDGNINGIKAGKATITVDFGNGEIRVVPVTVVAIPAIPDIPLKHYVCFGKTDGIGWYEVSVNGGDFFPQGPNSTLEVDNGSILVIRVQDMWIDDDFTFYVNGKKVKTDAANTITVVVDGYMLIGALSMDVEVPDIEESLNLLQKIIKAIKAFFEMILSWFQK